MDRQTHTDTNTYGQINIYSTDKYAGIATYKHTHRQRETLRGLHGQTYTQTHTVTGHYPLYTHVVITISSPLNGSSRMLMMTELS